MNTGNAKALPPWERREPSALQPYLLATAVVLGITLPGFMLMPLVGHRAIALVYLMAVVVLALFVGHGAAFFTAVVSALFWDFFFLAPITTLHIAGTEDMVMFGLYAVIALVLGQLTAWICAQIRVKRQGEEWATALYQLIHGLSEAANLDQMLQKAVAHLEHSFNAGIVVLLPDASRRLSYQAHPASTYDLTGPEQPIADWVYEQGQPAGKFTDNRSRADALFLPLTSAEGALGVVGLSFKESSPPSVRQQELLAAFLQQIAFALKQHRLRDESEKARRVAESGRLGRTLLNSMSCEMRAPLAVIKTATASLAGSGEAKLSGSQQTRVAEIQDAAARLNRLLENVSNLMRLESGRLQPKLDLANAGVLIHQTLAELEPDLARHQITVELAPVLPLVPMDFALMRQALANLLMNAALYTPAGTAVLVSARIRDGALTLQVADRGPGIPRESLPRLFDKFQQVHPTQPGGLGLGLALVKGLVEAQGGQIKAENRFDGGAAFIIRLPLSDTRSTSALPML